MKSSDINDLISVIIPVYNVEKYIVRCIESVINQTYSNIEIIIVNDGTKDNSIEKIECYILKDKRIKLINQNNSGLSEARNTGIKNSNGEFIIFVDSDDFIDCTMIEKMYIQSKKVDADITVCDIKKWDYREDKEIYCDENYKGDSIILNREEAIRELLLNSINGYSWNKMYKREIFKDIRFIKGILYEDFFATLDSILVSNKIAIVSEKLYYYVIREGSITNKITKKAIIDMNYRIEYVLSKINVNDFINEFSSFYLRYHLISLDWIYKYIRQDNKLDEELIKIINKKRELRKLNIINNKYINKNMKSKYILLKLGLLDKYYLYK